MKLSRQKRREALQQKLAEDPFLTDHQLAEALGVSVATVRLDRMALAIPELRVRAKTIAASTYSRMKALTGEEIVGDLVELNLGQNGTSVLEVDEQMVFARTGTLRGHFFFAQGNSLALAVVNSEYASTKSSDISFFREVRPGDRVVAKAQVISVENGNYRISVEGRVQDEIVFQGKYFVMAVDDRGGIGRG
ncbi:MAG: transcription factor FapR [Firmicutes bacterium]|nr:transcription factor FapR [Bacillota bacterium]NLO65401.1 transcription factor FapR [Bacillota bacterium]